MDRKSRSMLRSSSPKTQAGTSIARLRRNDSTLPSNRLPKSVPLIEVVLVFEPRFSCRFLQGQIGHLRTVNQFERSLDSARIWFDGPQEEKSGKEKGVFPLNVNCMCVIGSPSNAAPPPPPQQIRRFQTRKDRWAYPQERSRQHRWICSRKCKGACKAAIIG
jgi:hypothetical protein